MWRTDSGQSARSTERWRLGVRQTSVALTNVGSVGGIPAHWSMPRGCFANPRPRLETCFAVDNDVARPPPAHQNVYPSRRLASWILHRFVLTLGWPHLEGKRT